MGKDKSEVHKGLEMLEGLGKGKVVFTNAGKEEVAAHGVNMDALGTPMSQEDMLRRDDIVYVGGKFDSTREWVPGSKRGYFCNVCNTELLLSPSSQEMQAKGAKFICVSCAYANYKTETGVGGS